MSKTSISASMHLSVPCTCCAKQKVQTNWDEFDKFEMSDNFDYFEMFDNFNNFVW